MSLKELMVVAGIAILLLLFLLPAINIYERARNAAAPTVTARVMDSIESFQERHRQKTGNYAEGRFDRMNGDESIREAIGWRPSTRDGTVYVVESISASKYEVTAIFSDGNTMSRIYPSEELE